MDATPGRSNGTVAATTARDLGLSADGGPTQTGPRDPPSRPRLPDHPQVGPRWPFRCTRTGAIRLKSGVGGGASVHAVLPDHLAPTRSA